MKITNIKTIGFRRFEEEFSTDLYDITSITGANTKGKTTLVYAIVWRSEEHTSELQSQR